MDPLTLAALSKADAAIPATEKGAAGGVATLDADAYLQESSLPIRFRTPAPHYRTYTPLLRETFGDLTRWVPFADASVAADTVNLSVGGLDRRESGMWVRTNSQSLRMNKVTTSSINARMTCTLASPLNLAGHHGLLRYYVHEGQHASIGTIFVWLYSAGGSVYWADGGVSAFGGFKAGWRTVSMVNGPIISGASLSGWAVASGTFDPTAVTSIEIRIQTKTVADTPSVTFDFFDLVPPIATPVPYIIGFDGNSPNQKPALAYMAARGLKGTVYATYDQVNPPRMTVDDLKQAQYMGHYIDVHERAATDGWNSMTQAEKREQMLEAAAWKNENGFLQGGGFATLGTQWYEDEDVLGSLYPYWDHVRVGGLSKLVLWNPRIIGASYDTNVITSAAAEAIQRAYSVNRGLMVSAVVHGLTGAFSLSVFKDVIDSIATDTNVRVVTPQELLSENWY